mmetsp:Transcript_29431/g.94233  ORF Transcript_29431/g.94233 Transcript_29431/m.94233 type:complete len:320 (-) Transcript_29431:1113-2072(-)
MPDLLVVLIHIGRNPAVLAIDAHDACRWGILATLSVAVFPDWYALANVNHRRLEVVRAPQVSGLADTPRQARCPRPPHLVIAFQIPNVHRAQCAVHLVRVGDGDCNLDRIVKHQAHKPWLVFTFDHPLEPLRLGREGLQFLLEEALLPAPLALGEIDVNAPLREEVRLLPLEGRCFPRSGGRGALPAQHRRILLAGPRRLLEERPLEEVNHHLRHVAMSLLVGVDRIVADPPPGEGVEVAREGALPHLFQILIAHHDVPESCDVFIGLGWDFNGSLGSQNVWYFAILRFFHARPEVGILGEDRMLHGIVHERVPRPHLE